MALKPLKRQAIKQPLTSMHWPACLMPLQDLPASWQKKFLLKMEPIFDRFSILWAADVTAFLKAHRMSPLITITGLSEITGLAVQTIYNRHCIGGDLPPVIKLGKLIRFREADIEIWINSKVDCSHKAPEKPQIAKRIGRPTKAEQIEVAQRIRTYG